MWKEGVMVTITFFYTHTWVCMCIYINKRHITTFDLHLTTSGHPIINVLNTSFHVVRL